MTRLQTQYYEKYWKHRIKNKFVFNNLSPRVAIALKYLPSEQMATVLDIGCGDGVLGEKAKQLNPQLNLTGIDISTTALNLAKTYYDKTYAVNITDKAEQKKIPGQYDIITALEIIEHLIEPDKLLKFAYQRLEDNGKLIISFPNTAWWKYRWDLFFKGKFIDEQPTFTDQDHLHFFTLDSISELLQQHGFWIEKIDGVFSLPWYLGRLKDDWQRLVGKRFPRLFGYQVVLVCRKISSKPTVAHLMPDYLNAGETWLYTQIVTQKKTQPIVLTRNLKNANQLPYFGAVFNYPLLFETVKNPDNLPKLLLRKTLAFIQRLKDKFTDSELNFYRQILFKSKVSLIQAHYGPNGYRALKLKQKTGLPLVVSFCGSDAYWLPVNHPHWKIKYQKLFNQADAFIVRGPKMKQQLINLGCPKDKVKIIDHGIIIEQFPFKLRKPGRTIKLLTACNLIDYKGVDIAIKAFSQISAELPHVSLTVIGSGPEEGKIDKLIANLNLKKQVRRRPFMPLNQLIKEAEKYHIFLHPSFTSDDNKKEGSPTSIYERAASGMPVIATWHTDIPEIVKDGKNGFLVEERNVNELAEKLKYLIHHPKLWSKFGRYSRQLIEKKFDAEKQTAKREAVYLRLIKA